MELPFLFSGDFVDILSTNESKEQKLLHIKYVDVKKNSPDLRSQYENVLKSLNVQFANIDIMIHQNAILDLTEKINKFADELKSNAKNLLVEVPEEPERVESASPKPFKEGSIGITISFRKYVISNCET